ncbi:MAG: hypothetical protein HWE27_17570 [Gammaproteobacteria bacterium]|nr:hypothetical protein [Gammaproteobacteria bacterium]
MKFFCFLTFIFFLTACATPYQQRGFSGGFSETQYDENIFLVSFNGNAYTSGQRAADFTLLRSAELSLEKGYKYFVIINSQSHASQSVVTTPTRSTTTANVSAYGNTAYGTATTTTTGGNSYIVSKPSTSNMIVLLKEKPDGTYAFNAQFLAKSLKAKYNIKDSKQ